MAEPYDTIIEGYETLASVGSTSASIIVVLAKEAHADGDEVSVAYGQTSSLGSLAGPVDISGNTRGDAISISLTGLSPSSEFYYRIGVQYDGSDYDGDIIKAHTLPAATAKVLIQNMSDGHVVERINAGQTWATDVMANTVENMTANSEELGVPTMRSSTGDDVPYAKGQVSSAIYPIDEDGSTISGSNTHYAQSLTDTRRDCRLFKGIFGSLFRGSMFLRTQGNHDGGQHWHYAANNSAHNDAATYSYQGFNEHFGNAASSSGWTGDANGLWGTIRFGPVLCCYMNPYPDTILRTTAASETPRQPDDNNDWTLGQTQWDHFFGESGTISTANADTTPFVQVFVHNMLGASVTTGFERYGWGGARHIDETKALSAGQVFETGPGDGWTNPYSYTGNHASLGLHGALKAAVSAGLIVDVIYGHAHFYAREPVQGVTYVMCGRSAGGNPNTGDYGFRTQGGWWDGSDWTNTDENAVFRSNAGHINVCASPKFRRTEYIRSLTSGQTAQDGFNTNGQAVDQFGQASKTGKRALHYYARVA